MTFFSVGLALANNTAHIPGRAPTRSPWPHRLFSVQRFSFLSAAALLRPGDGHWKRCVGMGTMLRRSPVRLLSRWRAAASGVSKSRCGVGGVCPTLCPETVRVNRATPRASPRGSDLLRWRTSADVNAPAGVSNVIVVDTLLVRRIHTYPLDCSRDSLTTPPQRIRVHTDP